MKRAAIVIGIFVAIGFVGGFLYARFATDVIPTMKEQREAGPTRTVPDSWPQVRLSPGHSQHIVNERIQLSRVFRQKLTSPLKTTGNFRSRNVNDCIRRLRFPGLNRLPGQQAGNKQKN